jgi:Flp pilus assembly pilin Flp
MLRFAAVWTQSLRREQGQDLAEYALLLALVAVVLVLVIGALSAPIADVLNTIRDTLNNAQAYQVQ